MSACAHMTGPPRTQGMSFVSVGKEGTPCLHVLGCTGVNALTSPNPELVLVAGKPSILLASSQCYRPLLHKTLWSDTTKLICRTLRHAELSLARKCSSHLQESAGTTVSPRCVIGSCGVHHGRFAFKQLRCFTKRLGSAWYSCMSCARRRWVLYLVLWRKKVPPCGDWLPLGNLWAWTAKLTANVMTIELNFSWRE